MNFDIVKNRYLQLSGHAHVCTCYFFIAIEYEIYYLFITIVDEIFVDPWAPPKAHRMAKNSSLAAQNILFVHLLTSSQPRWHMPSSIVPMLVARTLL